MAAATLPNPPAGTAADHPPTRLGPLFRLWDSLGTVLANALLWGILAAYLLPMVYMFVTSIKEDAQLLSGVARLWPGCQGRMTVGTAQTGKPSVSSANTAARLPTDPRATWLDTTITARGGVAVAEDTISLSARPGEELIDPDDGDEEQHEGEHAPDAAAPELGPVVAVAGSLVPRLHAGFGFGAHAIEDAARFQLVLVPVSQVPVSQPAASSRNALIPIRLRRESTVREEGGASA